MRSAFALRIFSGKIILYFGTPERLRTLRCSIFTGGVVTENGSCSAAFCESTALRGYPLRLTTFASSPKGTPYGNVGNFAAAAEAVPLGKVASPQAMTEGVLPGKQAFRFSRKLYRHAKKLPLSGELASRSND